VQTFACHYLVPPIVRDPDGNVIQGQEVLEAIALSGTTVTMPVVESATSGDLAEIDQKMQHISEQLGVPIGPR
jgi:hypothetical protein